MKQLPSLEDCFRCKQKVFEFEDNQWGCDTCKSVWSFKGKTWVDSNYNKPKNKKEEWKLTAKSGK